MEILSRKSKFRIQFHTPLSALLRLYLHQRVLNPTFSTTLQSRFPRFAAVCIHFHSLLFVGKEVGKQISHALCKYRRKPWFRKMPVPKNPPFHSDLRMEGSHLQLEFSLSFFSETAFRLLLYFIGHWNWRILKSLVASLEDDGRAIHFLLSSGSGLTWQSILLEKVSLA